ncbi:hypothetical protein SAMN06273572_102385 [Monaibacterium marinum]|uniref:Uncharacterized protein n=1 Tax=Pontivivens marinum TaxID=1690039 RepID=A0A2C9CR58_9RHOB|nr:hypothetical protein [Monaibacterium marinum]SOH93707.1 hypothetical protein SAMN06273572_102385 [Monaibacterium marinum]
MGGNDHFDEHRELHDQIVSDLNGIYSYKFSSEINAGNFSEFVFLNKDSFWAPFFKIRCAGFASFVIESNLGDPDGSIVNAYEAQRMCLISARAIFSNEEAYAHLPSVIGLADRLTVDT